MKPKYEIGQRVMVRSGCIRSDDALICGMHLLKKDSYVYVRAKGCDMLMPADIWAYELDCSPEAGEVFTVNRLCVIEKHIYPIHDGGEEYSGITEFMDSLNKPKKVIA